MSSNDPSSGNKLSDSELSIQVKFLQSVLQNASVEDEAAGDNLAELLKQLDEAHGVAQGVEDKLDKILENLEGMIGDLEGNKPHDQNNGHSEQQQQQYPNKTD